MLKAVEEKIFNRLFCLLPTTVPLVYFSAALIKESIVLKMNFCCDGGNPSIFFNLRKILPLGFVTFPFAGFRPKSSSVVTSNAKANLTVISGTCQ